MVKNNKGWIRILEATIAVLLIASVLIVVYSKQIEITTGPNKQFENLQNKILLDISTDPILRNMALANDSAGLKSKIDGQNIVPSGTQYHIRVCNLTIGSPPTESAPCNIVTGPTLLSTVGKDVYAKDVIIAANSSNFGPVKVKVFIWE